MTNRQQRQDDHTRTRPHSERPLASPRTMQAHERCDQQAIPALEHDRRRRNGDQRQWAPSLGPFSQRVGTLKKRGCHAGWSNKSTARRVKAEHSTVGPSSVLSLAIGPSGCVSSAGQAAYASRGCAAAIAAIRRRVPASSRSCSCAAGPRSEGTRRSRAGGVRHSRPCL